MSKLAYITYFIGSAAVAAYFFGHSISGPIIDDIVNIYSPIFESGWLSRLFSSEIIFTREQLSQYDGVHKKEIYLAILGNVYDVSKGKNHYGPGEAYHGFVGKDASKAFVTGQFTPEGLTDDVDDLPMGELVGLLHWVDLYRQNYDYKGKLAGRFYDEDGNPTANLVRIQLKIQEANKLHMAQMELDQKYPACNLEWNQETGKTVWCSLKSGGVSRDWVGVPRKFYQTGQDHYRCACVPLGTPEETKNGQFKTYENCPAPSEKCLLNLDETDR